ncbi:hypothetical protein BGZ46_009910 [Entomortierella lignicola]|nr:hypothetical protein BGZ46_009910 [Entomortierella lignicola]
MTIATDTAAALPSPSATLNYTGHYSPLPSMALKMETIDNMTAAMTRTPEQAIQEQNLYNVSIDMTKANDNDGNNESVSDNSFSPPSPESCLSQSTTSATLVTTREALTSRSTSAATINVDADIEKRSDTTQGSDSGDSATTIAAAVAGQSEEEFCEPLFRFSLPDWETFKYGLLPTSKHACESLLATIILAFVTITLEAILLQRQRSVAAILTREDSYEISYFRPLSIYYFIFILAEVFAVGLLWDAAIHKNSLQLVSFTVFEWCMVSYSGLQIWQHDQLFKGIGVPPEQLIDLGDLNTRMILFSQLGVQLVACFGITLLTSRLYSEFGWLVFQKLGADVSLRKMMKEYRLLFTLLKLDAFFFFGYAIQVAALTDRYWQKGLTEVAFAIPLSAVIILLGFCALRNENKVTMGGFITCLALLIGYMTYRLVALYLTLTGDPSTDPYFFSRKTMTVFAALTLFLTILALVNAIVMLYNFNKGLKEAMQQYRVKRSGTIRSVAPSTRRPSVNGGGSICSPDTSGPRTSIKPLSGAVRNSRRASKRSLLHRDMSSSTLVMNERWQIE